MGNPTKLSGISSNKIDILVVTRFTGFRITYDNVRLD